MPLDNNLKIPMRESKEFPPLPEDIYQVELLEITADEKPAYKDKDKLETVLSFQFTVLDDGELRGRNIWRNYVPAALWSSSKNGKNVLWQIIEAIIMRELREDERDSMDAEFLNKLIGYQCRVVVKNNTKDGKIFNNIDSFLPKKSSLLRLTDDEKESARVKEKSGEPVNDSHVTPQYSQPAVDDEIPTINLDDDEPGEAPTMEAEENKQEIKITDVPF